MKPTLTILLAGPRGFCAGVDRAIHIVERALEKFGAPVYVRHEIVHNKFVVDSLRDKGAIFVDELDEVPDDRPVIFSAHGVAKSVPAEASRRDMTYVDATCPLVSKVHRAAEKHYDKEHPVILIGHEGHPEVIGTMGQLPDGAVILVENVAQAQTVELPRNVPLGLVTQTTLSVDDTKEVLAVLKDRYPNLEMPRKEDICYATTNRQAAVKQIAQKADMIMVIGAPNSSNSKRLVEVARLNGCPKSMLVQRADEIDFDLFDGVSTLGITAGASAPEILVEEVVNACKDHFDVNVKFETFTEEDVVFKLPASLSA
ncbi:4-hydroxy-3-methylbut-2-enyl diphosphate reductase [Terasakiella brassicae]|uniref:4-hydroxy-3-methylbut-2-enyl diphosphate reductase n=1 Tax=Terasakiella brassicae TaxID=1634917 RepID=A0A917BTJ9_9PROT|nr:4-hydroxy-3-methylbut-2-enyl diphosphate reductase [Terasakiella brassicae]GGF53934.1 4-hydroxy-3-methylbut-2-enyl diphosphate reductase [Terasakiella brassicae]